MTSPRHSQRMRARLAHLVAATRDWNHALDRVSPTCDCRLDTRPGFHPFDNSHCHAGSRCRAMTVLVIRTHMGMHRINTRALAAADVPPLVRDLGALLDELPTTTDWRAFAERLHAVTTHGRDPGRPDPADTPPKEHPQP